MNAMEEKQEDRYSNGHLALKIDCGDQPVDLEAFTKSLNALASFYKRYSKQDGTTDEATLLIKSISDGCIECIFITEAIQAAIDLIGNITTLISFGMLFKKLCDTGRKGKKFEDEGTKEDSNNYKDLRAHLEIIASVQGQGDAKVEITAVNWTGKIVVYCRVSPGEAMTIRENLGKRIAEIDANQPSSLERQTFYWHQARDAKSKSGDKGIIETISKKPLPVIFDRDADKANMLDSPLFRYAYIIDVQIGYVHGEAFNYVVLKVHDRISRL